ncbi:MAG: hypothetical protein WC238_05865 [Parcubacteria group bacterium]|jgi:hypothetical protein
MGRRSVRIDYDPEAEKNPDKYDALEKALSLYPALTIISFRGGCELSVPDNVSLEKLARVLTPIKII